MSRAFVPCLLLAALATAGMAHAAVAADAMTADKVFHGGQTLSLRGLLATESIATDLTFVNLAQADNRCTLALSTAGGISLAPIVTLTLRPGESRPFLDVFEHRADPHRATEAKAAVSCERDFYADARMTDDTTGRRDRIAPLAAAVGEDVQPPAPLEECPAGAVCFDASGVVHVPEPPPGEPVGRVAFPAPAGIAKRLRLSLDVTVADWFADEPDGKHLIYWFVVNKNIDMPGLLYFRGPNKNEAFARHGIGLKHPQKIKVIKPFTAEIGHTYHVVNDYDMVRHNYTITVTDVATGQVKVTLHSRPNVISYTIKPGSSFIVDMGFFPDLVPTEVPSYDWTFADVHVEAYMR